VGKAPPSTTGHCTSNFTPKTPPFATECAFATFTVSRIQQMLLQSASEYLVP
jgi:hypothetical protein